MMQHQRRCVSRFGAVAAALASGVLAAPAISGSYVPGTPESYVNAVERQINKVRNANSGGARFVGGTRWSGPGGAGDPLSVTFSFVPDGLLIPNQFGEGAGNSNLFATLDAQFAGEPDPRQAWVNLVNEAFASWEAVSGIRFNFVADDDGAPWGSEGPINATGNERQRITIQGAPGAGSFTLSFVGNVTAPIAFNAASVTVQGALEALPNIGAGNVLVTGPAGGPWVVEFINALGGINLPSIILDQNNLVPPTPVLIEELSTQRGDIRIGMKPFADGPGGLCAVASSPDDGDIMLDSNENWADPGSEEDFRFFLNCLAREIGTAIGLQAGCPQGSGTFSAKLMHPIVSLDFVGPQHDDIRAANFLYGDQLVSISGGSLVANNTPGAAFSIPEMIVLEFGELLLENLSIDTPGEEDFFSVTVGETDVRLGVTLTPVGGQYNSGPQNPDGSCQPGTPVNSLVLQNLRMSLIDSDGVTVLETIDTNPAGMDEGRTFSIAAPEGEESKTFFIRVTGTGGVNPEDTQLYNINFQVFFDTSGDARVVEMFDVKGRINHQFLGDMGYTGLGTRLGIIEGSRVWGGHDAFAGRVVHPIIWNGADPVDGRVGEHATGVAGAAAGNIVTPTSEGLATGVEILTAPVATVFFGQSFLISQRAVWNALWRMADPQLAAQGGLPGPATVINASWGALGDITGEGALALAHDAVASMTGVTIVVAAGNDGLVDNHPACQGPGGNDIPGGAYVGARTVSTPATAWNVLSVGNSCSQWSTTGPMNPIILRPDRVKDSSSKGPIDSFDWERDAFEPMLNQRPGIHVVAPGTGWVNLFGETGSCPYNGAWMTRARLNLPWFNPLDDPVNPTDSSFLAAGLADAIPDPPIPGFTPFPGGVEGSSFSAPMVSGSIALLQEAGLERGYSITGIVMRSVIMSGARKLPGWSNSGNPAQPQESRNGRSVTIENILGGTYALFQTQQPLDFAQGAGVLDIRRSAQVYLGRAGDPGLQDSPLTDPNRPTVRRVIPVLPPNPFPFGPGDAGDQGDGRMFVPGKRSGDRVVDRTPLSAVELARAEREVAKVISEPILYSNHPVGDPEIRPREPIPPGGGSIGATPIIPPIIDGRIRNPDVGDIEPAANPTIIDGAIFGGVVGWDHANLGVQIVPGVNGGRRGYIDYLIGPIQPAPNVQRNAITATLVWNRTTTLKSKPNLNNPNFPIPATVATQLQTLELEDLDLLLFRSDPTGTVENENQPVFQSISAHNNVEHVFYIAEQGLESGWYVLRVNWDSRLYDLHFNSLLASVRYALSWRVDQIDVNQDLIVGPMTPTQSQNSVVTEEAPGPKAIPGLSRLLLAFGSASGDEHFDPVADLNGDGRIDSGDVLYFINNISR